MSHERAGSDDARPEATDIVANDMNQHRILLDERIRVTCRIARASAVIAAHLGDRTRPQ
jgi:hypothetical protein